MALSLQNLTFDCENATELAAFWSAVLGRPVEPGATEYFARIAPGGGDPLTYLFIKVPEAKTRKNRCHPDFHSSERVAEVERIVALGAKRLGDFDEFGLQWSTLADPDGNEFDIGSDPHPV